MHYDRRPVRASVWKLPDMIPRFRLGVLAPASNASPAGEPAGSVIGAASAGRAT
jgi:hypothetical protein